MPRNSAATASSWIDPDDAPELDDEWFDRAALRIGEIELATFCRALARNIQEVVDDSRGAKGLALHLLENRAVRITFGNLGEKHLRVARDPRDRRVHLMRHARREFAQSGEAILLAKRGFHGEAFGDVVHNQDA